MIRIALWWLSLASVLSAVDNEPMFEGNLEVGYRVRSIRGSDAAYRSISDLGRGPRLVGSEFRLFDPQGRWFDRIETNAQGWGDDPASTLRMRVSKAGLYEFRIEQRNFSYFNALPSYASPLADRDILLNQRSVDLRRKLGHYELVLRPGGQWIPFFSYERQGSAGRTIENYVSGANEYAVPGTRDDRFHYFRGGLRLEKRNLHASFTQSGAIFEDTQTQFEAGAVNSGYRIDPYFGRRLVLNRLEGSSVVSGTSVDSNANLAASLGKRVSLTSSFLLVNPKTEARLDSRANGLFANSTSTFLPLELLAATAQSRIPHIGGHAGGEWRMTNRIRLVAGWLGDRFNAKGNAFYLRPGIVQRNRFEQSYSQLDADLIVQLSKAFSARGGYRLAVSTASFEESPDTRIFAFGPGEQRRQFGKFGVQWRPSTSTNLNWETEIAAASRQYFRSTAQDYFKNRLRGRTKLAASLQLNGELFLLENRNPLVNLSYRSQIRQSGMGVQWNPKRLGRLVILGNYSRTAIASTMSYLSPGDFRSAESNYRERAHSVDGMAEYQFSKSERSLRFAAGGVLFRSTGTRPARHALPMARIDAPLVKHWSLFAEWRYQGFSAPTYSIDSFQASLFTVGARINR